MSNYNAKLLFHFQFLKNKKALRLRGAAANILTRKEWHLASSVAYEKRERVIFYEYIIVFSEQALNIAT